MIDAVIFDLGNVLAFHDNALLFSKMATLFKTTPEQMQARLDGGMWREVNIGELPGDSLRRELIARLGTDVSVEQWVDTWNCHFTLNHPQLELIEHLVGRVKLVLLSNTHDLHFAYLRPLLPVLEKFDGLALSYEVGHVKPEKEIYQAALKLAAVPAARSVFFDDVKTFTDAATQFGMQGRVYTNAEKCREDLKQLGVEV